MLWDVSSTQSHWTHQMSSCTICSRDTTFPFSKEELPGRHCYAPQLLNNWACYNYIATVMWHPFGKEGGCADMMFIMDAYPVQGGQRFRPIASSCPISIVRPTIGNRQVLWGFLPPPLWIQPIQPGWVALEADLTAAVFTPIVKGGSCFPQHPFGRVVKRWSKRSFTMQSYVWDERSTG